MAPAPDSIALRAAALMDLVEGNLEVEGDAGGPQTAWPMVGRALLGTSSLRSIVFRLRPDGAHNDASRLLRSLYDHIVTFAWLGRPATPPRALAEGRLTGALEDSPRVRGCRRAANPGRRSPADGTRHRESRGQGTRSRVEGGGGRQALGSAAPFEPIASTRFAASTRFCSASTADSSTRRCGGSFTSRSMSRRLESGSF